MLLPLVLLTLIAAGVFEAWRVVSLYRDLTDSRDVLLSLRGQLDLSALETPESELLDIQSNLRSADSKLSSAKSFADTDPLLFVARHLPVVGKQATGLKQLIQASKSSTSAGIAASDVLLAYQRGQDKSDQSSIQAGLQFLQDQRDRMATVRAGVEEMRAADRGVPGNLWPPLERAHSDLDDSLSKLEKLVDGYDKAATLLPPLLGYDGPKRYLILAQNDTELFPSGGLISNYGVGTFDHGALTSINFEYFVNLFDRWQALSGGEYVAPPPPLKNYLLRDVSWGLGEAGWFPDFPTTAGIASDFVTKGGVAPTDGTIAIDLQFVAALLDLYGPVDVPEYNVTVTRDNLSEVTLEQTRGESAVPGAPGKAFLAGLAQSLLGRLFSTPRDQWVDLLKTMDQMGRERHLQLYFKDEKLEGLAKSYGLDGSIVQTDGDFLLLADSSVQSTKLNLILQPSINYDLQLRMDDSALALLSYQVHNPFREWQAGRSPALVRALMLNGVYGSYLRLYARPDAQLRNLTLNGSIVGAEQIGPESGKMVFGRFFPVVPDSTARLEFLYATPGVVHRDGSLRSYSLYIQKEAGTNAVPFSMHISVPAGATDVRLTLDGVPQPMTDKLEMEMKTDHSVEVQFRLAEQR